MLTNRIDIPLNPHVVFSDGSFDAASGQGVGACLIFLFEPSNTISKGLDSADLGPILTKIFETESCARLELLSALWALELFEARLEEVTRGDGKSERVPEVCFFTDSKTIVELPARRKRLETGSFTGKRSGKILSNGDLYRKFFEVADRLNGKCILRLVWLKGHTAKCLRTPEQATFAQVDHAARAHLRRLRNSTFF